MPCQDQEFPSVQNQDENDTVVCSKPVRGTVIFENSQIDPKVRLDSNSAISQADITVVKTVIDSFATDSNN